MAVVVVMPKLGNTVESSVIVTWHKAKGDPVKQGETLCEVETDKAMMEVESPASGTLLDTFFKAGDDVPVLTHIAAIGEVGENIDGLRPTKANGVSSTPVEAAPSEPTFVASPAVVVENHQAQAVGVSPRARKLAQEKGVSTEGMIGSGPSGRIIERDVIASIQAAPRLTPLARSMVEKGDFVAPAQGSGAGGRITTKDLQPAKAAPAVVPQAADEEVEIIPVRGVRKRIAERMLASLQTTAQLTLNASADARAIQDYRKRLKASAEALGLQSVTMNHLILFGVSRTLVQFPELNSLLQGETISRYKQVHLGFAVDTPRGLMVPVIRSANRLSLKQIANEADRLAKACVEGNVQPDELNGATFSVSNLGSFGIESFTPVLNPPQVGILGVGNINLKAVEVDDDLQFIPHIGLSLTVDHQAVDGAPAARFLQALCRNLAQLDMLLAL